MRCGGGWPEQGFARVDDLARACGVSIGSAPPRPTRWRPGAQVHTVEVTGTRGDVHRVVTRSEILAVMTDGRLEAAAPTVIVALDAISRDILEVTDLSVTRTVALIELPAPNWWRARPGRLRHVQSSVYGLPELDIVA